VSALLLSVTADRMKSCTTALPLLSLAVVTLAAPLHQLEPRGAGGALSAVNNGAQDAIKTLQHGLNADCWSDGFGACLNGTADGTNNAADWFREHLDPPLRKALNSFGKLLNKDEPIVLDYLVDAVYPALAFVANLFRSGAGVAADPELDSAVDALADLLDHATELGDQVGDSMESKQSGD